MGTGVLRLLGGEVENRYVRREGPDLVLDYWGGNVQTPVCKRTRHPDFPPKLATNSAFKPVSGCARPHRFKGHGCSQVNGRARDYDSWRRFCCAPA